MSTPSSAVAKRVRVAFAADLAVGDDVEAGLLLRLDRERPSRRPAPRRAAAPGCARAPARARAAESDLRASRGRSAIPAAVSCRRASSGKASRHRWPRSSGRPRCPTAIAAQASCRRCDAPRGSRRRARPAAARRDTLAARMPSNCTAGRTAWRAACARSTGTIRPRCCACGSSTTASMPVDRRERHVVRGETRDPLRQRATRKPAIELRAERFVVIDAALAASRTADRRAAPALRAPRSGPARTSRATRGESRSAVHPPVRRMYACASRGRSLDLRHRRRARSTRQTARPRNAPSPRASRPRRRGPRPLRAALEQRAEHAVRRVDAGDRVGERGPEEARPLLVDDDAQEAADSACATES